LSIVAVSPNSIFIRPNLGDAQIFIGIEVAIEIEIDILIWIL